MTWREANTRVQRIANALLAFGLQPEQRCCILAETSVEWILADVAILCAGGATTTIYPTSTVEECAYIIDDCDATLVFCDTVAQVEKLMAVRNRLPNLARVVVFRGTPSEDGWVQTLAMAEREGREWGAAIPEVFGRAHRHIAPDRLVTLMCSSGTTGAPKWVLIDPEASVI